MIGQKFNRLTIVDTAPPHVQPSGQRKKRWLCLCDCGKKLIAQEHKLKNGHTGSCGCFRAACTSKRRKKHGATRSSLFTTWVNIKQRCNNPNRHAYKDYGGRGIKIHPEWNDSFVAFASYVGERPSPKHSLDRIDNNGNYEPGNVRWVTIDVQAHNRRDNVFIDYNGERKTISQWADFLGIKRATLCRRIYVSKWSIEKAFTTPLMYQNKKQKK